jgi:pilus assembly protein CpaF
MDFEVVDPFGPEPIAPARPQGNAAERVGAGPAQSPQGLALDRLRQAAVGPEVGHFTTAEMEAQAAETVEWCRREALRIVRSIDDESLSRTARRAFDRDPELVAGALLNELFGLGQLEELLHKPGVEDIAINGPRDIWYKGRGGWIKSDLEYPDSQTLLAVLNRAIVHSGRQAGPLTPIVDAALRTGHRINIVTDPLAHPWPVASIRLHRFQGFTLADLVGAGGEEAEPPAPPLLPDYSEFDMGTGLLTALGATFLHMAVVAGLNLLVVGPTGVGKTTVLGALGRMIPPDKRIVLIEDTPELNFRGGQEDSRVENAVYFRTRVASVEGLPPVTQRDLVLAALRQRPDALTVGEARGAEVFEMLKALWTGHRNGLTSIHADSIEDVPSRIRMMLQEAHFETEVSEATVALWISKAFHLGITLREANARQRYVEEITEFTGGVEGTVPVRTPLFVYDHTRRRLVCTGHRLDGKHEAMLNQAGCYYDDIVEAARERGELR